VAVFSSGLDISSTETKGTVLLHNASELMAFSKGEEDIVEKQVKDIAATGVNVIISGGKVADMMLHFCNKYNLMVVRIPSKFDLRRLCLATNAVALARVGAPTAEEIGHCDDVHVEEIGDSRVIVFSQSASSQARISTIVIRGSTMNLMDDIGRAIDDGVATFKQLSKDGRLCAGAGAVEIEVGRRLQAHAARCPGLDQYSIRKFGVALECVARALADNAGLNSTETISKLYAAHQAGQGFAGVDIATTETAATVDAAAAGIYDTVAGKVQGIRLAGEAAATVLRVDQIIMAKAAGGPKAREEAQRDADDD
jgi:T-complex protein 1 subunit theta